MLSTPRRRFCLSAWRLPRRGVPAGVLYDLVAAPGGELPWRLTIHFRGFPDRQLAAYGGESALRGAFFGSLKEAACIARGSAQRVMEMAAGAQACTPPGPPLALGSSSCVFGEGQWEQAQRCSLARAARQGASPVRAMLFVGGPVVPGAGRQPAALQPDTRLPAAGAGSAEGRPPAGRAAAALCAAGCGRWVVRD